VLATIYDEEFGFQLTMVRRYVRNQRLGIDEERNPNTEIVGKYSDAFHTAHGHEPDSSKLTRLRALSFDVLPLPP
jgi:hypothetical protein